MRESGVAVRAKVRLPVHRAGGGLSAVRAGVEGRLVGLDVVRALQDVDLTIGRPVSLIDLPSRGPSRATLGHVADVEDGDVVRAVRVVALDANRVAARAVGIKSGEVISAHDEGAIGREGQVLALRGGLVDIVPTRQHQLSDKPHVNRRQYSHPTVGRICDRLMDESGQEALTDKGILEGVGGTECGGNERGHGEQRSCRTHDEKIKIT